MSTPETLRWWGDQIRKCTREFYFSHVLVADLNYGADEIEKLQAENAKLRELAARAYKTARMMCEAWDGPCQSNSDVPSWRVPCPTDERDEQCVFGQLERDMRELGMEVDV